MKKITISWPLMAKFISGNCNEDEKKLIQQWIEQDIKNQKLYEQMLSLWNTPTNTDVDIKIDAKKAWEKLEKKIKHNQKNKKQYYWIMRIAAGIALLIGIFFIYQFMGNITQQPHTNDIPALISFSNKEVGAKQIILPDSSIVYLNQNSEIAYTHNYSTNRNIILKGEAYFEVRKDSAFPFSVCYNSNQIKVLGTSFNVKTDKQQNLITTVFSGRVALYNKKTEKIILNKGEEGICKHDGLLEKNNNIDKNILAWKTGTLIFENDNLAYICETLSNYYHKTIIADNVSQNQYKLNTTFKKEKLENVLEIISYTLNLNIINNNDTIIFTK